MVTGVTPSGKIATLAPPAGYPAKEYGPVIPGPHKNKPNASLKEDGENSGYSSDPKMYLKLIVSPDGTKSNSKTTPFVTVPFAIAFKCGSVETLVVGGALLVNEVALFGPCAPIPLPVVNKSPALNGNEGFVLVKEVTFETGVFALSGLPLIVTFEAVTPKPSSTLLTSCVGVWAVLTKILWAFRLIKPTRKNRTMNARDFNVFIFSFS
jgi:hypothetical protein